MKKLQDQKHDMEREIKILHRKLRVSEKFVRSFEDQPITDRQPLKRVPRLFCVLFFLTD